LEDAGFDAVVMHPRFFEERFRRRARWELLPWIREMTSLPLIANGDFGSREQAERRAEDLAPACAIMIGRRAIAQPWVFAGWDRPVEVDPSAVWRKFCSYVCEDFPEPAALGRLKMFTRFFSSNFAFGHAFRFKIQNATTVLEAEERADTFFASQPALLADPVVAGL
jgi:tRNA-dihydrouridine synthase